MTTTSRATFIAVALASLTLASGCAFITKLTSAGGADAAAFTVDMEKYDVKSIRISTPKAGDTLCPGDRIPLTVLADAIETSESRKFLEDVFAEGAEDDEPAEGWDLELDGGEAVDASSL